jgi:hypothetical protein
MPGIDGGVLETAALVASLAGTAMSAVGAYEQGQAQNAALKYQAQVAANNAQIAAEQTRLASAKGEQEATQQGLLNRERQGQIVAGMAANGVDVNTGSAANVRSSQDILGMQDVQTKRENAAIEGYGYRSQGMQYTAQSALDLFGGKQAATAGTFGAATSLLGGVASAGDKYANWLQKTGS